MSLGVDSTALDRGLQMAQAKMQAFGRGMMAVGAGIAGMGAAVLAPFAAGLNQFVSMGSAMQDMSDRTGVAVESLSRLTYAAEQSGASADDVQMAFRHLAEFMGRASTRGAETEAALRDLGLSFEQLNGLSPEERISAIAEGMSNLGDATRRAQIGQDIFSRSSQTLMPLLRSGADGIRRLGSEADRLGITMRGDDAAAAEALGDQFSTLGKTAKMAMFSMGAAVAPVLKDLLTMIINAAGAVNIFVRENRTLLSVAAAVGVGLVSVGATVAALGVAFYTAGLAIGLVSSLLTAVVAATGFVVTGMGIGKIATLLWTAAWWLYNKAVTIAHVLTWAWIPLLGALGLALSAVPILAFLAPFALLIQMSGGLTQVAAGFRNLGSSISGAFRSSVASVSTMFFQLVGDARTAWGGIMDAFKVGDWQLLWEIVKTTAFLAWERISFTAVGIFNTWKDALVEVFFDVWASLRVMFETGWAFIKVGFITVAKAILRIWDGVSEATAVAADRLNPMMNDAQRRQAVLDRQNQRIIRDAGLGLNDVGGLSAEQRAIVQGNANVAAIQNAEAIRAGEAFFARQMRDAARAAGNAGEVARLEGVLADLADDAARAEATRRMNDLIRARGGQIPGGPGGELARSRFAVAGSFNASALFGALGASGGGETPLQRILRVEQDALAQQRATNRIAQDTLRQLEEATRAIAAIARVS